MPLLFDRLKADCRPQWSAYVDHRFVREMGQGDLPLSAFRTYLVQDYLFLIQFARAYALAIYKGDTLEDMQASLEGVKAILDTELELHLGFCAEWDMQQADIVQTPEDVATMAYTRFVLDTGMAGDLLDLQAALAPCILGYAEIGRNLIEGGLDLDKTPYRRWIEEYSGDAYQAVAGDFAGWFNRTGDKYLTPARYEKLRGIFEKACRLEADFWEMGYREPR